MTQSFGLTKTMRQHVKATRNEFFSLVFHIVLLIYFCYISSERETFLKCVSIKITYKLKELLEQS